MLEHLQGFFSDFSVAATLPSSAVVRGIFDNGTVQQLGMMTNDPSFIANGTDVASISAGNVITIGGNGYTVRTVEPDGTGITRLVLEAA